jgi:hypothetical protein
MYRVEVGGRPQRLPESANFFRSKAFLAFRPAFWALSSFSHCMRSAAIGQLLQSHVSAISSLPIVAALRNWTFFPVLLASNPSYKQNQFSQFYEAL